MPIFLLIAWLDFSLLLKPRSQILGGLLLVHIFLIILNTKKLTHHYFSCHIYNQSSIKLYTQTIFENIYIRYKLCHCVKERTTKDFMFIFMVEHSLNNFDNLMLL